MANGFARSGLARVSAVAAGVLSLAGCGNGASVCDRPPTGQVTTFLEQDASVATFSARVVGSHTDPENGLTRYELREGPETHRHLVFRAPGVEPPLRAGLEYSFEVETVPGMPTPSALVLRDSEGKLLFVGVSDYAPGDRVLTRGLPGFGISVEEAGCKDRGAEDCLEEDVNLRLRVEHQDAVLRLHHGESGVVGGYRVTCLTARRVTYSPDCADAGVFGVSYVIEPLP